MEYCDVLIVGAGPGGLAAAKGAREAGAENVIVLERDTVPGGILNQCIHDGFGLIRYKEQLTGPEYAARAVREVKEAGAKILTGHQVIRLGADREVIAASREGLRTFQAGAVVLSTGCRERTRGAISIPGTRPAGIFTAGVVQNLVNVRNIMPGKRIVILGSGDIGMIMARRLTLEGAKVLLVAEILPEPAGLARNVSQCLYDYGIPIRCSHTVSRIIGKKKLTAVGISRVDEKMRPVPGTEEIVECDALVLSVGLIPENEIAGGAGVLLDGKTNGALTDAFLQTNIPGIFSCGNARKIMDLADFVSLQGETAGKNAAAFISGAEMTPFRESGAGGMIKGFPEEGTVTCTLCPNGCQVRRTGDTYTGNRCPRGAAFAKQEHTAPQRTVTTTVRMADGGLLPVRSGRTVPKEEVKAVLSQLREVCAAPDAVCGQEIAAAVLRDGERVAVKAAAERRNPSGFVVS